jgi:hypothetical protein
MNAPKVTKTHRLSAIDCGVELNIRAKADRIWSLLTDAEGFPRWNSIHPRCRPMPSSSTTCGQPVAAPRPAISGRGRPD